MSEYVSHAYHGLQLTGTASDEVLDDANADGFLRLFLLLYADDTIILAESGQELKAALWATQLYCDRWKLEVNAQKTKVVIFSKGKSRVTPVFAFNNSILEVVSSFCYLGIDFNYNGSFSFCKKKLYNQAQKAMYSILGKSRRMGLPIDIQLELFSRVVEPILTYGSEVWGYENNELIERLQLKFCRILLNVNCRTPKCMVYGELGKVRLQCLIDQRLVTHWGRVISNGCHRISKKMYLLMYHLHMETNFKSAWIGAVQSILGKCGLSHVWRS